MIKQEKVPPFRQTQNVIAAIPDLRESHDSFVRLVNSDFQNWGLVSEVLEAHEAIYEIRRSVDPDFTDPSWKPVLPGDQVTPKEYKSGSGEISDLLWPELAKQIIPRDAENINLRTARVGDRIYSCVYIELFPKEVQTFVRLFSRTLQAHIPWRISFLIESEGLASVKMREIFCFGVKFYFCSKSINSRFVKIIAIY